MLSEDQGRRKTFQCNFCGIKELLKNLKQILLKDMSSVLSSVHERKKIFHIKFFNKSFEKTFSLTC